MKNAYLLLALFLGLVVPSLCFTAGSGEVNLQGPVFPFIVKPRLPAVCNAILESVINNTPGSLFTPKSIAGSVKPTCLKFVSPEAKKKRISPSKVLDSCETFYRVLEDSLGTAFQDEKVIKRAKKHPKKVAKKFCGYFAALDSHLASSSVLDYLDDEAKKDMCLAIVSVDDRSKKFKCEAELTKALKQAALPLDSVPSACESFMTLVEESRATGSFGEDGTAFCARLDEDTNAWHAPFSVGEPNLYAYFDPTEEEEESTEEGGDEDKEEHSNGAHGSNVHTVAHTRAGADSASHAKLGARRDSSISVAAFSHRVVHAFRSVTDAFWAFGGDAATGMLLPEQFNAVCHAKLEVSMDDCQALFSRMDWSQEGAGDGKLSLKEWLDALGMDVTDLRARIGMVVGGVDAVFKGGDANSDGKLSESEFVRTATAKPLDISNKNAHRLFGQLDPDHDGELTQQEFTDRLGVSLKEMMHRIHHTYGSLNNAFQAIDTHGGALASGDGVISESELNALFDALKVPLEDRAKLTHQIDRDGDGQVTVQEMMSAFPVDGEELRFRIYEDGGIGNPKDAFERMDESRNGSLDKREFAKGVEPYHVTPPEASVIFDKADTDADKRMNREEFYNVVGYMPDGAVSAEGTHASSADPSHESRHPSARAAKKQQQRITYGSLVPWGDCETGACSPGLVPAELSLAKRAKRAPTTTTPAPTQKIHNGGEGEVVVGTENVPETVALAVLSAH